MSTTDFRSLQATFVPRGDGPGHGRLYFWCMPPRRVDYARRALAALGILRRVKIPPPGRLELVIPTPTRNKTEDWEIAELGAIRLSMVETVRGLVRLDLEDARRRRVSDSVRVWSLAAKLAVELVARGHMVPVLDRGDKDVPYARWAITSMTAQTRERLAHLERALPIAAYALVLKDGQTHENARRKRRNRRRRKRKPVTPETMVWRPSALLRSFLDSVADAIVRDAAPSTARDRPKKDNRELAHWELRWRYSLTAADPSFESAGLIEQPLVDEITRWASPVRPRVMSGTPFSVAYQLEKPGSSPETSMFPDAWYLRFNIQPNDDPSVQIDARQVWSLPQTQVEIGGRTYVSPHETLLESLAETSRLFPPVYRALVDPKPCGVMLTTAEAWEFISRIGPILFQFGVGIRVPSELRSDGHQRLRLRLHVGGGPDWSEVGAAPSKVGVQSLAMFHWQVALGDHDLSAEEFREIASLQQPLVQWRGQWMAVDPDAMSQMRSLFEGANANGTMDRAAALAAALSGSMATDGSDIEVVAEGEIERLVDAIRNRSTAEGVDVPKSFQGTLRPYQANGLTWLSQMTEMGFGVCLADDMGLGKTIQVIAMLLVQQEKKALQGRPALLICPTSVLGNWERELKKFAPSLAVHRYHGRNREALLAEVQKTRAAQSVVLTTYVIARMDAEVLGQVPWSNLVIDEAQNIKNPVAQQARAVRSIHADRRVALTGTPVENRLSELWSILEFCNPGLLGKLPDFRRRFSVPIERFGDQAARETLRRMVSPFILRRVKSDPAVIQDLPEKQEYKVYCTLTREQASLYQAAVDLALQKIEGTTGGTRQTNILALLTRLKQICNHPVHYLREENGRLLSRSGKLTRLMEMLEEVFLEGDRALIFTQYKEMGDLLVRHIADQFGVEAPFIHGGVPAEHRDRIVAEFQQETDGAQALVLSLKAAGTGLNLTRATHVFHFDRWWNPAVEDQATDRAYRVGQTRNVQVHKLIVSGTIEEKIDELVESKRDLSDVVATEGTSRIAEMSDRELRDLFSLGHTAALDDEELETTA
jgi:hypothetical protein